MGCGREFRLQHRRPAAERGIPLMQGKKVGADGNLQAWIEDPDGNRIELMQMAPDGLQAEAIRRFAGSRG